MGRHRSYLAAMAGGLPWWGRFLTDASWWRCRCCWHYLQNARRYVIQAFNLGTMSIRSIAHNSSLWLLGCAIDGWRCETFARIISPLPAFLVMANAPLRHGGKRYRHRGLSIRPNSEGFDHPGGAVAAATHERCLLLRVMVVAAITLMNPPLVIFATHSSGKILTALVRSSWCFLPS